MSKSWLTKSEYVSRIADVLTNKYGSTLRETNTDITMAQAVVRNLNEFLFFRVETAESRKAFQKWKNKAENR